MVPPFTRNQKGVYTAFWIATLTLTLVGAAAGGGQKDETLEVPSPAKIKAGLALMDVHYRLSPVWNTEIHDRGPSSFTKTDVRGELKRFVLNQLREDQRRDDPVSADPRLFADFPRDFRKLRYVRAVMIHPKNHRYGGFHTVLANTTAINGWGETFPEGSLIVKLTYPAVSDDWDNLYQGALESVWVFKKDSARFSKKYGGWGFQVFDLHSEARLLTREEHVQWCYNCHSKAKHDIVRSPGPGSLFAVPRRFKPRPFTAIAPTPVGSEPLP